jgi:tetratricopeptide (TPR) repeat protein
MIQLLRFILIFTTIFMTIPLAIIATPFNDAEILYNSGQYAQSKAIYESLVTEYPHHGTLWYNLGNTYLKSDDLGMAIVSYRKATQRSGYNNNNDLIFNLTLARAMLIDKMSNEDTQSLFPWSNKLHTLSISTFFWAANGVLLLFLITWVIVRFYGRIEFIQNLFVIFLVLTLGGWILFGALYKVQVMTKYGVLISKKVPVKSGPSDALPTLFYIHEGIELTILKYSGEWSAVELNNGLKGWILLKELVLI